MKIERALLIDDDPLVCECVKDILEKVDIETQTYQKARAGIAHLKKYGADILITDMKLPDKSGLDVIRIAKTLCDTLPILVITGHGSIENAIEAMQLGAANYLTKPFTPKTLITHIHKIEKMQTLLIENQFLKQEQTSQTQIIAESPAMIEILKRTATIAKSDANIFIYGESGTGKEVIAELLHNQSLRHEKPYIKVNCAAMPESLVESEFFGYEKGAFTGASDKKLGRFELAHEGSLLLDEITEIPINLQAKLLRAIQEKTFERVGGTKSVHVDIRFFSTSNQDINQAIIDKNLREDLYYRLNVIPIYLPPLRKRHDDIIPLARYFLQKYAKANRKNDLTLSPNAETKLIHYRWPGNVRELSNIMERAAVLATKNTLSSEDLFLEMGSSQRNPNLIPELALKNLRSNYLPECLERERVTAQSAAWIKRSLGSWTRQASDDS